MSKERGRRRMWDSMTGMDWSHYVSLPCFSYDIDRSWNLYQTVKTLMKLNFHNLHEGRTQAVCFRMPSCRLMYQIFYIFTPLQELYNHLVKLPLLFQIKTWKCGSSAVWYWIRSFTLMLWCVIDIILIVYSFHWLKFEHKKQHWLFFNVL